MKKIKNITVVDKQDSIARMCALALLGAQLDNVDSLQRTLAVIADNLESCTDLKLVEKYYNELVRKE